MLFSGLFAVMLFLQAAVTSPQTPTLDLRQILSDNAALSSVEIWYSVEGQFVAVHGSGEVVVQDTARPLQLLPTCKGKVSAADVRKLVRLMATEGFTDLPSKSYFIFNGIRELKLHSISLRTSQSDVTRMFAAGKEEIPRNFAEIENAIAQLKSQAISPDTRCTVAPPLWSATKWRHDVR